MSRSRLELEFSFVISTKNHGGMPVDGGKTTFDAIYQNIDISVLQYIENVHNSIHLNFSVLYFDI